MSDRDMLQRDYLFCEVILPLHLPNTYTYRVPSELIPKISVGSRVAVQFGKKRIYSGLVAELHERVPDYRGIKYVLDLIDAKPIVPERVLRFWQWIASYYVCYIGDVMTAAMPSSLRLMSETKLLVNPDYGGETDGLSERQLEILAMVNSAVSVDVISARLKSPDILTEISDLLKREILVTDEQLNDKYRPKKKDYIYLSEDLRKEENLKEVISALEADKRSSSQLDALLRFVALSGQTEGVERNVLQEYCSKSSVNTLVRKGVFVLESRTFSRLRQRDGSANADDIMLDEQQQKAFDTIVGGWDEKPISLLHGVTGSGKTEVYIKLIDHVLKQGKQVLYLLPEIALSAQLVSRLEKYFGPLLGVYHSMFSKDERVEIWNKVLAEEYRIVVGARSSVFLPFTDLGLVIVDEEHDSGFKQTEPAPRYNARDASLYLSKAWNLKVVLGSATPSVESYFNAQIERYQYAQMPQRYAMAQLPSIEIVDLKHEYMNHSMLSIFSSTLYEAMVDTLMQKKQIILFKNLRGYSSTLRCDICGWVAKCDRCDVTLTVHKQTGSLNCHYCGKNIPMIYECPVCHSHSLVRMGTGSEKIEEQTLEYFPDATVRRMDLDTTRNKQAYQDMISDFERGKIDILCGTQILTKGLDFENVGLVGVIDADAMLYYPDFRAYERTFDLLTQVGGRAGRGRDKGRVIIQTFNPFHQVFKDVCQYDYKNMYTNQIMERKLFKYPPFYHLLKIVLQSRERTLLDKLADDYVQELRKLFDTRILGPEYPPVAKIREKYHKQIILKLERERSYQQAKQYILRINEEFLSVVGNRHLRIFVDVDPV